MLISPHFVFTLEMQCLKQLSFFLFSSGQFQVFEAVVFSSFQVGNFFSLIPNNKISDQSKLKVLAQDKINMTENLNYFFGRLENIVGKGENAGYQHFLLFPQCFQMDSFSGLLNVEIVW